MSTTPRITIVGAGMAGLLAANMLQRHNPRIIEAQAELPNNHSAVLRFGSDKVAEVTGIPFKRVKMIKSALPWRNPVADALMYATKCGGTARSDRSIPNGVERGERWIAPPDLIARMANGLEIDYNTSLNLNTVALERSGQTEVPYISTIPMPCLMDILGYKPKPEFSYVSGANIRVKLLRSAAYATLYVPNPAYYFNRVSITGDELIAEYAFPEQHHRDTFEARFRDSRTFLHHEAKHIAALMGVEFVEEPTIHYQRYAKIQPIDEIARKKFLAWATDNYNIFSLGRFATWRPGLLMDELVHDVRQIERWMTDRYAMKFAR